LLTMAQDPQLPLPPPRRARWREPLAWFGRALLWLPAALLGALLALALAVGLWASSEGSLAQALRWGLAWQEQHLPEAGQVLVEDAEGSVAGGGRLRTLRWSREGLTVSAEGVRLRLGARFWFGLLRGEARIAELQAERLQIDDQSEPRPETPREPLQAL